MAALDRLIIGKTLLNKKMAQTTPEMIRSVVVTILSNSYLPYCPLACDGL
jgi:hypothetical protein